MANFLIQKSSMELEEYLVKEQLIKNKYLHTHKEIDLKELDKINERGLIPIGTIDFVTKYLRKSYDFKQENPIEVPKYLRTEEFLKRDYYITSYDKIPKHGTYFLKDVSELKKFGMVVQSEYFLTDDIFKYVRKSDFDSTLVLSKEHKYLVSSVFHVAAEYRVYVLQGEIENISYYDGDCTILPDVNLIKKAINLISYNEKYLRSYTLDIMVDKNGNTAIIEVHNFSSVGLYSNQWGSSLLYGYVDGIDYLLNDNKEIEI